MVVNGGGVNHCRRIRSPSGAVVEMSSATEEERKQSREACVAQAVQHGSYYGAIGLVGGLCITAAAQYLSPGFRRLNASARTALVAINLPIASIITCCMKTCYCFAVQWGEVSVRTLTCTEQSSPSCRRFHRAHFYSRLPAKKSWWSACEQLRASSFPEEKLNRAATATQATPWFIPQLPFPKLAAEWQPREIDPLIVLW
jgi:hypothetical protein